MDLQYTQFVLRDKISTLVHFPEELDMAPYVTEKQQPGGPSLLYELYAVSVSFWLCMDNCGWACLNREHVVRSRTTLEAWVAATTLPTLATHATESSTFTTTVQCSVCHQTHPLCRLRCASSPRRACCLWGPGF